MGLKLGQNIELTWGGLVINESKPTNEILKSKIVERQLYRFNADIGKWRQALNAAESIHTPQRAELLRVFQEVNLDAHLSALIQSRISKIMAHNYKLVDPDGEESDQTALLQKNWFKKTIKYISESIFYGYSLIEYDDLNDFEFGSVELIKREHIEPSKKIFKKEYYLTTGLPFLEDPFNNWTFYVEQDDNKGLLNKAAPLTIWKKNALGSWGDYSDMFGVPPRIGKTNVRDDKLRKNMENMLENMGRLSYGVFDKEDTIELVKASGIDAFNVFMRLANFCNQELSKLILGQTMTTDSGSSRSQSETHERTLDSVIKADTNWIEAVINTNFIPFLIEKHNFPLQGLKFKFDHTESLSLTEQMDMTKALLPFKDVPNDWINKRFGIPVEDKTLTASGDPENFFFDSRLKEFKNTYKGFDLIDIKNEIEPEPVITQAEEEQLYNDIYTGLISVNALPKNLYLGTAEQLERALFDGYGGNLKAFKPDTDKFKLLKKLHNDLYKFSAAKTFQNTAEMQSLLRTSDGALKTFAEFKKEAGSVFDQFNKNHLKTEFNTAQANAQNAENRQRMSDNKDVKPYAVYRTQGDDRVRDEHAALEGVIVEIDSPEMSAIDPQNDWNCRCFWESTSTPPPERIEAKAEIFNAGAEINPLFAFSSFDDQILYPKKHPYYKVSKQFKTKKDRNFDLPLPE